MAGKRKARAGADRARRTPLHYAAGDAKIGDADGLLAAGADPNARDDDGWTPLHFAAQAQAVEIARALLAAGAEVDARDAYGNTPLFKAVFASQGEGALITLLRDARADPNAVNASGISPLARSIGNFDVARFFADLP